MTLGELSFQLLDRFARPLGRTQTFVTQADLEQRVGRLLAARLLLERALEGAQRGGVALLREQHLAAPELGACHALVARMAGYEARERRESGRKLATPHQIDRDQIRILALDLGGRPD